MLDKHTKTPAMQSLPPLSEVTGFSRKAHRDIVSETSTCSTPDSISESGSAVSDLSQIVSVSRTPCESARPPQNECIHSKPNFRYARLTATPPMLSGPATDKVSVQDVRDAVVSEVPHAKVAHVHSGDAAAVASLISIRTPLDFSKGFGDDVPSFILVDSCEECANLAIQMVRSQPGFSSEAVIVVLFEPTTTQNSRFVIEKIPDFVESGANDIIVIPAGAIQMHLPISASLAKAQACKQQWNNLKRQVKRLERERDQSFWETAHEVVDGLPRLHPKLTEVDDRRVGDMNLVCKLGQGAFGAVHMWENRSRTNGGAVKITPKSGKNSVEKAVLFATEFSVLQRLNHENVVAFCAAFHGTKNLYLFMEMAGTHNLFKVIHAEGNSGLQWPCAQDFLSQIASAVAHCHENNVAHCDLKPENIVISDSGCAKLVDFGQAADLAISVPQLQGPLGTMPFTAPEVMLVKPDWDPTAADVWSLGVIAVEMMCGNHAFRNLLGWQGKALMCRKELPQRANDLEIFFARNETEAHATALETIFRRCRDRPPQSAMQLLGGMLEFTPESRIFAKCVAESICEAMD